MILHSHFKYHHKKINQREPLLSILFAFLRAQRMLWSSFSLDTHYIILIIFLSLESDWYQINRELLWKLKLLIWPKKFKKNESGYLLIIKLLTHRRKNKQWTVMKYVLINSCDNKFLKEIMSNLTATKKSDLEKAVGVVLPRTHRPKNKCLTGRYYHHYRSILRAIAVFITRLYSVSGQNLCNLVTFLVIINWNFLGKSHGY